MLNCFECKWEAQKSAWARLRRNQGAYQSRLTDIGSRRVQSPRGVLKRAHQVVMAAWWNCWWTGWRPRRDAGRGRSFEEEGLDRGRGLLNSERSLLGCASRGPCGLTKETEGKARPSPQTPSSSDAIDRNNNSALNHFLGLNLKPRARSAIQVLICLYFTSLARIAAQYDFSEINAKG